MFLKALHLNVKLIASDSDNDEAFKYMHQFNLLLQK